MQNIENDDIKKVRKHAINRSK